MNNRRRMLLLGAILLGTTVLGGSIKVWSAGEYITSTDINANFAHIHNQMVGGHGGRLVNADVSNSAAISHSKLATPSLLPKAWAVIDTCAGTTDGGLTPQLCTMLDSSGVTKVEANIVGHYTVTIPARGTSNYGVLVSAVQADTVCNPTARTSTTVSIGCEFAGTDTDSRFTILIMDTEN